MAPLQRRTDSSPRALRSRGARLARAVSSVRRGTGCMRVASVRAPSPGLQLAVDRREDPEPDEQVGEGQERGRIEWNDPSDERPYCDVKADPDIGIQRTAGVVDQSKRDVMGAVFQIEMQRREVG